MAEEIQQAVQIIRVAYDGIEIVMKLGTGTIEQMKKAVDMLIAILDHEKTMGKTDMRKLLLKGGDLQVLQFASKDRKQVEKMAKKYGILYSVLPDINTDDGMSEIVFHTEAVPRVNMMVQKLKSARIATFDDYLQNGKKDELEKAMKFLEGQKRGNDSLHTAEAIEAEEVVNGLMEQVGIYVCKKQSVSVEEVKENFSLQIKGAEQVLEKLERIGAVEKTQSGEWKVLMDEVVFTNRMREYWELLQRMKTVTMNQDKNLLDITITKKLVIEENDHAVKTRVPGMWGENAKYIWLPKDNNMDIHDGKTILTFLDSDKEYKLYSADNRIVGSMKGSKLYEEHYDKISKEIRERYAKVVGRTSAKKTRSRSASNVKR